jgi:hypothetical protein
MAKVGRTAYEDDDGNVHLVLTTNQETEANVSVEITLPPESDE